MKMKKKSSLILILALLFLLSSCKEEEKDILAKVGKETISLEDLNRERDYFAHLYPKEDMETKELVDLLVYDKLLDLDFGSSETSVEDRVKLLYQEAVSAFDSKLVFEEHIKALGLSMEEYLNSLKKEAKSLVHQEAFFAQSPYSSKELEKFYRKKKDLVSSYHFYDIALPTRMEVRELMDRIEKDPKELDKLVEEYRYDDYEDTRVEEVTLSGYEVREKYPSFVLSMEKDGFDTFRGQDFAHLIYMLDVQKDFSSLMKVVEEEYRREKYEEYIRVLSKDYDVRIYEENFPKESIGNE